LTQKNIKVAIIGVGNCASSLVQGLNLFRSQSVDSWQSYGLMHEFIGGYAPSHIEIVTAYDIDQRKVGYPLHQACCAKPNCTKVFFDLPKNQGPMVQRGPLLDGMADHMLEYAEAERFVVSQQSEPKLEQVVQHLKEVGAQVLLNLLPVGSQQASEFYMEAALQAGLAVVNGIPVFIASNLHWQEKFQTAGLPVLGDDVKAQFGATIVHRALVDLCRKRGVKLKRTYQLNTGGNTDFLNMLDKKRLGSKKISKTESVQAVAKERLQGEDIHIGPSDYIPWLKDNKICHLRIEADLFGGIPLELDLKLSVEDSPNSAGVLVDALRCAKLALDRGLKGAIEGPSAYFFKSPPIQFDDASAYQMVEDFIYAGVKSGD